MRSNIFLIILVHAGLPYGVPGPPFPKKRKGLSIPPALAARRTVIVSLVALFIVVRVGPKIACDTRKQMNNALYI